MEKTMRILTKLVLILISSFILAKLGPILGLTITFMVLNWVMIILILSYRPHRFSVEKQVPDYYSVFNLTKNFSQVDLEEAYKNGMDKLGENLHIAMGDRLELMGLLQEGYETLNDPISRLSYEDSFEKFEEEIKEVERLNSERKFDFGNEVTEMLSLKRIEKKSVRIGITVILIIMAVVDVYFKTTFKY